MRELFFIFLVLVNPDGSVETRALQRPYTDADQCAVTADHVLALVQPKFPRVRGALCYTIDELWPPNAAPTSLPNAPASRPLQQTRL